MLRGPPTPKCESKLPSSADAVISVPFAGPGAGSAKLGWLKVLKKLVRNSNPTRSPTLNVLCREKSQAFNPGAAKGSRGQLPKVPGAGKANELREAYGCVK